MRTPIKIGRNWFLILSREEAEKYQSFCKHVLISVTDPGSPPLHCLDSDLRQGILRLSFSDVQETIGNHQAMLLSEATQLVDFYLKHEDIDFYVIHCEAGISRSPAIGAAIVALEGDSPRPFWDRYWPNGHVFSTILAAHQQRLNPPRLQMF